MDGVDATLMATAQESHCLAVLSQQSTMARIQGWRLGTQTLNLLVDTNDMGLSWTEVLMARFDASWSRENSLKEVSGDVYLSWLLKNV